MYAYASCVIPDQDLAHDVFFFHRVRYVLDNFSTVAEAVEGLQTLTTVWNLCPRIEGVHLGAHMVRKSFVPLLVMHRFMHQYSPLHLPNLTYYKTFYFCKCLLQALEDATGDSAIIGKKRWSLKLLVFDMSFYHIP